jgi:hypothetical protein
MNRLVVWCLRELHQEGCIVHLDDGYISLPPDLLFPLLVPHLEREIFVRQQVFLPKGDPRRGNGILPTELLSRLKCWGDEGRWERIQEWMIRETAEWAERKGLVRKKGEGYWPHSRASV